MTITPCTDPDHQHTDERDGANCTARGLRNSNDIVAMQAMELGRISSALLDGGWEVDLARPLEGCLEVTDPLFPAVVFVIEVT